MLQSHTQKPFRTLSKSNKNTSLPGEMLLLFTIDLGFRRSCQCTDLFDLFFLVTHTTAIMIATITVATTAAATAPAIAPIMLSPVLAASEKLT